MKKIRLLAFLILLLGLGFLSYGVLNTRLGVHYALDVLSEWDKPAASQTKAEDGPLKLSAKLQPVETIVLPPEIEQASGIKHRNGKVYIGTDQTEVFTLDENYQLLSGGEELIDGMLLFKQGSLEGIEVKGADLLGVGEFGQILVWGEGGSGNWIEAKAIPLPSSLAESELTGIVSTPEGLVAVADEFFGVIDLAQGELQELDWGEFLLEGRESTELAFSGIGYAEGDYYILSEEYTCLLLVEASSLKVRAVYGLEAAQIADLSVHEGKVFVVTDHNYDEERTPISVYELPPLD